MRSYLVSLTLFASAMLFCVIAPAEPESNPNLTKVTIVDKQIAELMHLNSHKAVMLYRMKNDTAYLISFRDCFETGCNQLNWEELEEFAKCRKYDGLSRLIHECPVYRQLELLVDPAEAFTLDNLTIYWTKKISRDGLADILTGEPFELF